MALLFEKPASHFPTVVNLSDSDGIEFVTPVTFDITVRKEKDVVMVQGQLSCTVMMACSRCLVRHEQFVNERFKIRFSREIPRDLLPSDSEDIELTADQIGLVFFKDDTIDLKETLQEQVVMALPYKPLCSADCKGLCPRCGADLNQQDCGCEANESSSPFAVLKNIKLPSK